MGYWGYDLNGNPVYYETSSGNGYIPLSDEQLDVSTPTGVTWSIVVPPELDMRLSKPIKSRQINRKAKVAEKPKPRKINLKDE